MVFGALLGLLFATGSADSTRYGREVQRTQDGQAEEQQEQENILHDDSMEKRDKSDDQDPANSDNAGT